MVHGVAGGRLAINLLEIDLEVLGYGGRLLGRSTQGQKAGVEIAHVGLEHVGRITLRIDRDKDRLQTIAVLAQHALDLGHFLHSGRAHIGALGIAKENHRYLALEVFQAALLAVVVGQLDVAGIVHLGDVHATELWLAFRTSSQKASSAYQYCASSYRFKSIAF